jgi:hypothetical protein
MIGSLRCSYPSRPFDRFSSGAYGPFDALHDWSAERLAFFISTHRPVHILSGFQEGAITFVAMKHCIYAKINLGVGYLD